MPEEPDDTTRSDYDEAWKELLDQYLPQILATFFPEVAAAKAQIEALRTVGDPEKRFEIRWRMTRALYEHGFTPEEVRAAYRLLSWMMRLPREMQLTFRRKIIEYEEREKMPYITDIEEMAAQLERRFGVLAPVLRSGVEALPLAKAEQLALALLDFQSVSDLEAWLRG